MELTNVLVLFLLGLSLSSGAEVNAFIKIKNEYNFLSWASLTSKVSFIGKIGGMYVRQTSLNVPQFLRMVRITSLVSSGIRF